MIVSMLRCSMRRLLFAKSLVRLAGLVLIPAVTCGAWAVNIPWTLTRPQEVSFNLNRVPENPRQYSLVISDSEEHNISGSFYMEQLEILRAIMVEAQKFAMTSESAGVKEAITTRFMDKEEKSFIVDVQKNGTESRLFLTLKTELGRLTLEAGRTNRGTRREEGFFFDLLGRLESILPKHPAKPDK
ncbi:MAG: hypothetical protein AABN34_04520 [Acidobacteriota bacterium]